MHYNLIGRRWRGQRVYVIKHDVTKTGKLITSYNNIMVLSKLANLVSCNP